MRIDFGESIDDVGKEIGVNVARLKLAVPLPVLGPVGKVPNHLLAGPLPLHAFDVRPAGGDLPYAADASGSEQ